PPPYLPTTTSSLMSRRKFARAALAPASPYAVARAKLNAAMRALYEDTAVPVREIARLAGITDRAVYTLASRYHWRLRSPAKGKHRRRPVPRERLRESARVAAKSPRARQDMRNLQHAVTKRRQVPTVAAELEQNAAKIFARRRTHAERTPNSEHWPPSAS